MDQNDESVEIGEAGLIKYPANHIVGVVDTMDQITAIVSELRSDGLGDSEIFVHSGSSHADALESSTGRTGLAGVVIRIAEALGIENVEMEVKSRYEQATRDGHYVILVAAPSEERKDRVSEILEQGGAHTVAFHGRFTIEGIVAPENDEV